jgi:hypothetical protein
MDNKMKYTISLSFEEIKLPPFNEILVLGKNAPHGKHGISKSFELLIPNGFEIIDVTYDNVDSVLVNKRILAKLPKDKLINILQEKVFPYVSDSELLRVDLKVSVSYQSTDEED